MQLLKFYSLLIGVILVINLGSYFLQSNETIPTFKDVKVTAADLESVLLGRWEFLTQEVHPMTTVFLEGEVEYFSNGTFTRYVNYKEFYNDYPYEELEENSFSDFMTDLVITGHVTGTWQIKDQGYWEEIVSACDMKVEYCSHDCDKKYNIRYDRSLRISCISFYPEVPKHYGTFENESSRIGIEEFSEDEIVLKRKEFKDNIESTLSFKRIKS